MQEKFYIKCVHGVKTGMFKCTNHQSVRYTYICKILWPLYNTLLIDYRYNSLWILFKTLISFLHYLNLNYTYYYIYTPLLKIFVYFCKIHCLFLWYVKCFFLITLQLYNTVLVCTSNCHLTNNN